MIPKELYDANDREGALAYISERAKQLGSIGITLSNHIFWDEKGVEKAIVTNWSNAMTSIFIYRDHRDKGLYPRLLQVFMPYIMTMKDCGITGYLDRIKCNYQVVEQSYCYDLILSEYGSKVANRSKVPLMDHIDQGLDILNMLPWTEQETRDAYCLHPLVQSDAEYVLHLDRMDNSSYGPSKKALMLAMEYRYVANSYLSNGNLERLITPTTTNVHDMLVADKYQNEKDFRLYHEGRHERSDQLREYFDTWINEILELPLEIRKRIEKHTGYVRPNER